MLQLDLVVILLQSEVGRNVIHLLQNLQMRLENKDHLVHPFIPMIITNDIEIDSYHGKNSKRFWCKWTQFNLFNFIK